MVEIHNNKSGQIVKIPTLDIVKVGHNNRVFGNMGKLMGHIGGGNQQTSMEHINLPSSSSEDSKAQ